MSADKRLAVRGYLIHLTHYDPRWCENKSREGPFELEVGLEIVGALAGEGFNLLVVDCADAVQYRSHPELARPYTVPTKHLETLACAARDHGLEVVPKLNYSRSQYHHHNDWILAPGEAWHEHFDDEPYWQKAFELIDELVSACRPTRFFHVGMDEDHDRSYTQYAEAIKRLHAGLAKRGLRTLIWNDTAITYAPGQIHAEKSLAAEKAVPREVVQIVWDYHGVPEEAVARIGKLGFELWGAPGSSDPAQARAFRDAICRDGGKGLLMTAWTHCDRSTREWLLARIRQMGPIYRGEG